MSLWTITHEDSNGIRVKTFSYDPHVWPTKEKAQTYLTALLKRGDLQSKIFQDDAALMVTMKVSEMGKF